ncbi:MAG: exopolysaccharide biosynthesis protein [Rhodobacteraceae bacterium]|uniref:exopolysaccharide biosynthesis protein n=1 Tax=Celeribacter sp. HF31 TaxID=2721558 RepID=UPI0014309B2F|nr:exopolysaccharide biosynthesis protein [Celeribacter sp. HF31]NIY80318.1 exopolysaccharide biosynthesis protein [Celeribacter sp. HF31]NVK46160.1 exopolysaccharide biosynthesis protein [Paracoccaceae bacterium]
MSDDGNSENEDHLTEMFGDLDSLTETQQKLSIGKLVKTMESRGVGPFYVLTGMLVTFVGSIPGLPAIAGGLLILLSAQTLRGKRGLWVPRWLRDRTVSADTLRSGSHKAQAFAAKLAPFVHERLTGLVTGRGPARIFAVLTALCGLGMILVGFIPGLPIALALPLIALGIGLTGRDGVWIIAALLLLLPGILLLIFGL